VGGKTEFTLPDNRMLTAGQEYHWAVEAKVNGQRTTIVANGIALRAECRV